MRVALVIPRWTDTLGRFDVLAQLMVVHYPLNVAILGRYIENNGDAVEVIDAQVEGLANEQVVDLVLKRDFDLVGYSITSPLYDSSVEIASKVRKAKPHIIHVAGGAHINALGKEAFNDVFDYLVRGEAEETVVELLNYLKMPAGIRRETIRGLIYRSVNGEVVQTPPRPVIEELDSIAFQAAHLLKLPQYVVYEGVAKKTHGYVSMVASRGCPYKCVFCAEPLNGRKLRFRSPENIAAEMEYHVRNLGVRNFFFVDSCLTLNREQILRLCAILIEKKLPVTWSGWTRVDLVDEELLGRMKEAGLVAMSLGIESADPGVLKIIKKGITLDQIRSAFAMMEKLKIEAFCSAMIGLPGETRESVMRTIRFIRHTRGILYATLSIATPYPGTQMYRWVKEGTHGFRVTGSELRSGARWDDCGFSINDLQPRDLIRLQRLGMLWIHLTPRRVLFILRMLGMRNIGRTFLRFVGVRRTGLAGSAETR